MTDAQASRRSVLRNASAGFLALAAAGAVPLEPPDKQPPKLDVPEGPEPKRAGYAVVGLGKLALEEIIPAFAESTSSKLVALVSGHPDKAAKVAGRYGVDPKAIYNYENYDTMADNPAINIVYICLPNSMHAEYTIRAHKAGKHVLCEKPMATSVKECESMIAAAKEAQKKLMIAYRLRYEPYNQSMIEMAQKKVYGPIRFIEAVNAQNVRPPNIRLSKELGGGAMGDIGIYCLQATRYITGEEPIEVTARMYSNPKDPRFREVEEAVMFQLRFPSGVMASCSSSFSSAQSRRYRVHCADGWMELDPAFSYRGLKMRVGRSEENPERSVTEEIALREVNHFAAEMDHFSECFLANKNPLTPGEEGLQDMRIIAAINESAQSGKTVQL